MVRPVQYPSYCHAIDGVEYHFVPALRSAAVLGFAEGKSLQSLIIPDQVIFNGVVHTVERVVVNAFAGSGSLEQVVLPEGLTHIGAQAFFGCTRLTDLHLPGTLLEIGDSAFQHCDHLYSVTLPLRLRTLGICAFAGCRHLASFDVHPQNTQFAAVDGVLFDKSLTRLVAYPPEAAPTYNLPLTVRHIGRSAFWDCDRLTTLTPSPNLVSIGNCAFLGCGHLTAFHFPPRLRSIGRLAFAGCHRFVTLRLPRELLELASTAFVDCTSLVAIDVDPDNRKFISTGGAVFLRSGGECVCYPPGKRTFSRHPAYQSVFGGGG